LPAMKPEILAPAGDKACLLAAFAAGADAVYLGLKHFSARMQSDNFSLGELARLAELAHAEGRKIFVALNSLLKPGDPVHAARLIAKLERDVHPDALICQDLGAVELARQVGISCELHLSTLANLTHPASLRAAARLGADRVILPRELNIDELRQCSESCPEELNLEIFVHGALCYCVSGRCYWSSYMGGKSGLRGRCVQPCRRVYKQRGRGGRFFSCQDLSLDVLGKVLMTIPKLISWKIEGRKKGPHYVYHVARAYRIFCDNPGDAKAKKEAEELLAHALSRPRTKAGILPHRPYSPVQPDEETGSGLLAGKVLEARGAKQKNAKPKFKARFALYPGDYLRVGYVDEPWHFTTRVNANIKKGGIFWLSGPPGKRPKPGTGVFLIDRRGPELISLIKQWEEKLAGINAAQPLAADFSPRFPEPAGKLRPMDMRIARDAKAGRAGQVNALWLSPPALKQTSRGQISQICWWLPPVIWPDEEQKWQDLIDQVLRGGGRRFMLGSPWQVEFFEPDKLELWAGPFCNPSNLAGLAMLKGMGCKGAVVSPELSGKDMLELAEKSPLPLGVVIHAYWPMGISRLGLSGVKPGQPFTSPKGEVFWARNQGQNTWIYPGWPLDIRNQRNRLIEAGYSLLVTMTETPPKAVPQARRSSTFNWDLTLL
jgi:putative protease